MDNRLCIRQALRCNYTANFVVDCRHGKSIEKNDPIFLVSNIDTEATANQ